MFSIDDKYKFPNSLEDQEVGSRTKLIIYFSLVVSILAGAWIRFYRLDIWPLGVDEYYIVQSIKNILNKGIPAFDTGGYYVRGLIYQYLAAFLIILGIKIEIAVRIIPALTNLLAIPALYLLTKKISNLFFAAVAIAIFSFSIWEIEMARFARMYAPFQAIFLWYLLFLYQFIIEKNNKSLKWIYILSTISIFVFEASIFLCVLNFVPMIWYRKFELKQLIISLLILLFGYLYLTFDFTHLNVQNYLPADITLINVKQSPVQIPTFLGLYFANNTWLILLVAFFPLVLFTSIKIIRNTELSSIKKISALLLIGLALINQFGLMFYMCILLLLIGWIELKDFLNKNYRFVLLTVLLLFAFWLLSGLLGVDWSKLPKVESTRKIVKTLVSLFNYPQIYYYFKEYVRSIPFLTAITIGIISLTTFWALARNTLSENYKFLLFVLLFSIIVAIAVSTDIVRTRYLFFLFPVILILTVYSIQFLLSSSKALHFNSVILYLPICLVYLVASEDFNFDHLINVSNSQKNYRLLYNDEKAGHFFETTFDAKAPAVFVNSNLSKNDIVIIDEVNFDYYLKKVDYVYSDYRSPRTRNFSAGGGKTERWTNAKLIYKSDKLFELFNSKQVIWFITGSENNSRMYLEENNFYKEFERFLVFSSIDGYFNIYKIVI